MKNASVDHAQIKAWFDGYRLMNIGLATGRGLAVIDVDAGQEVLDRLITEFNLPPTAMAK